MGEISTSEIRIKRRGDDGNKTISVRIKESTLDEIDRLASDAHYSRNELINILLEHGIKNAKIVP